MLMIMDVLGAITLPITWTALGTIAVVMSIVAGFVLWLGTLMFVKRSEVTKITNSINNDMDKIEKSQTEMEVRIQASLNELSTKYQVLTDGPLRNLASQISEVNQTLKVIHEDTKEHRTRLMDTLHNLDRRLVVLESSRSGKSDGA